MITSYSDFFTHNAIKTADGHTISLDDILFYMHPTKEGRLSIRVLVTKLMPPDKVEIKTVDGGPMHTLVTLDQDEICHLTRNNPDIAWDKKSYFVNAFRKECMLRGYTMHYVKGNIDEGKAKIYRQGLKLYISWHFSHEGDRKMINMKVRTPEDDKSFDICKDVTNDDSIDNILRILTQQLEIPETTL